MPAYTIVAVDPTTREWSSTKGGPMRSYKVTLRNAEGNQLAGVEWSRKVSSDPPVAGKTVEGTVEKTDFGPKLKVTPAFGGGGGGGGRSLDPRERRAIAMQASHKVAVDIVRLALEREAIPGHVAQMVRETAELLYEQVQGVEGS